MQTGGANDDGEAKLWVNGTEEAALTDETYCTSNCSAGISFNWGSLGVRTYNQEPTGIVKFDNYRMTVGTSECVPRASAGDA